MNWMSLGISQDSTIDVNIAHVVYFYGLTKTPLQGAGVEIETFTNAKLHQAITAKVEENESLYVQHFGD